MVNRYSKKPSRPYWRLNYSIHAPKVRVIDDKGKQIGVLTISKALQKAKEAGLDLVEIAPKAKPPVTKIVDFGKFKYAQDKKERKQLKGAKKTELKEVRFSPFIADGDYKTRLDRINEFLGEGNKVKIVVKFKGRQMGSKQFGYKLIDKLLEDVESEVSVDMKPKFLGRHLATIISPTSKKSAKKIIEAKKDDKSKAKN